MAVDLEKFEETPHLVDILIQLEDVLDSLDCYCFKNFIEGEIISGPHVKRHWLSMSLLYDYEKMPDPRIIMRLHKHGIKVDFSKVRRKAKEPKQQTDENAAAPSSENKEGNEDKKIYWMLSIDFPRRLVGEITDAADADLEEYEDDVEMEDVEDAQNAGINDESGYVDDENATQADPDQIEQQDVAQGGGRAI